MNKAVKMATAGVVALSFAWALPVNAAEMTSVGKGEGEVDIVAWAGYIENGSSDKAYDWVTDFEKETGCKVNVKVAGTSDEMVTLMNGGGFDLVTASGDASLRLIAGKTVQPINTDLIPNWKNVDQRLQNGAWHTVDGKHYGTPYQWGPNVLMYNTDAFKGEAPKSWSVVFNETTLPDGKSNKGRVQAYSGAIYIADAALYLMATKPDLGIKDPYSLTSKQLDAAVALLKQQKANVGEYWADYTKEVQAFESGTSVIGTTWQVIANTINTDNKTKVQTVVPKEGSTGWSDTWMIAAKAKHPNCMYKWMNYIVSPSVNAQVAEYFGEAPAQTLACDHTSDRTFCVTYHAVDPAYANKIHYWTTPQKDCVDGSGATNCTDYAQWVSKWQEIKG